MNPAEPNTPPTYVSDLNCEELERLLADLGEPAFRARQLLRGLYRSLAPDFASIPGLPASLRAWLELNATVSTVVMRQAIESADGYTFKHRLELRDGHSIESVLMLYDEGADRRTVCVSSQVGCRVRCPFCATGAMGFTRDLTAGEIADQVFHFARLLKPRGEAITNVAIMGMGEPFFNYDNVWRAVRLWHDPEGFNQGARRVTISTAGVIPGIQRMASEDLQVGLAVSLHAVTDTQRDRLVPINRRYPLRPLRRACEAYVEGTGRRVTFEYSLIAGVNDSPDDAEALAEYCRSLLCHVNLIRLNPHAASALQPSGRTAVAGFQAILNDRGVANTLRVSRGGDILAACGQLCTAAPAQR